MEGIQELTASEQEEIETTKSRIWILVFKPQGVQYINFHGITAPA